MEVKIRTAYSETYLAWGAPLTQDMFRQSRCLSLKISTCKTVHIANKKVWLTAQKGKGLEISGTWSLRNNVITMEMTFSNKAMQAMQGFGIQLNKNSFGMTTSQPLNIPLLNAGQTLDVALPMTCTGPVLKMDPLTNIQV